MDEPVPIDPERLLAQTAWVRRLARSLARDEASADDLVQETFVAALRRPPAGAESESRLRAWFGFVVRNMAIRRTRSELRREERERRSVEGGHSGSDERAEELEELRAELYRHVKALAEPARQVVLLHYFEELDSAEIARRLGVPDSTVRNRLKRALAELRERLEREHGSDWRSLCLFVLPPSSAQVAAGTGAVAAAAGGLWIAGGAIAAVALALVLWIRLHGTGEQTERESLAGLPVEIPRSPEQADSGSTGGRSPNSSSGLDTSRTPAAGALHVVVSDSYEPPPTTPFAHGIIVYGVVRDENGEPIDGVQVGWIDPWGRMRGARTEDGKYSANSFAPGVHVVSLSGRGCGPVLHELTVAAEPELQEFDFSERRAHLVPMYVLDSDGGNLVDEDLGPLLIRGCGAVMMHKPPDATVESWFPEDGLRPDWSGLLQHYERGGQPPPGAFGVLQIGGDPPYFVSLLRSSEVLATQRFEAPPESVTFRVERSTFAPQPIVESTRRTFVTDQDGIMREVFRPGVQPPARDPGVSMHLQFLDASARPVMAQFKVVPERGGEVGGSRSTWSWTAHADGTRTVDDLLPGKYLLCVTGTADGDVSALPHLGALPRRFELNPSGANELLVVMSPTYDVLLRSRCAADELLDWEIRTQDQRPVVQGPLVGHAPRCVRLPAGEFVFRVRARSSRNVLAEQSFSLGEKPLVIELSR